MTTNLNIRIDKSVKEQSDKIFNELGPNMTTAINMFLRTTIRENGIPFELKLDLPNDTTLAAIKEGKELLNDPNTKKYSSMSELKAVLEDEI
jgi:DNA-damage-inducible protein J